MFLNISGCLSPLLSVAILDFIEGLGNTEIHGFVRQAEGNPVVTLLFSPFFGLWVVQEY
jgi:hypothetical protein